VAVLSRQDDGWEKGHWKPWKAPFWPGPAMKQTIAIACGGCGRAMCLPNHRIAEDGSITPSVVCPFGCGWHVFLLLKDWNAVESQEQQEVRQ
jgi:hypothetical protein